MRHGNLELMPEDCALLVRALEGGPLGPAGARDRYQELLYALKQSAALVPAPLNGDKVWGGSPIWRRSVVEDGTTHNQCRTIVRAKSKAEAKRLMIEAGNGQGSYFDTHWSVTGNREELALAAERGVWVRGKDNWVRLV